MKLPKLLALAALALTGCGCGHDSLSPPVANLSHVPRLVVSSVGVASDSLRLAFRLLGPNPGFNAGPDFDHGWTLNAWFDTDNEKNTGCQSFLGAEYGLGAFFPCPIGQLYRYDSGPRRWYLAGCGRLSVTAHDLVLVVAVKDLGGLAHPVRWRLEVLNLTGEGDWGWSTEGIYGRAAL